MNQDFMKQGKHPRQGAASAELLGNVPAVFKKQQGGWRRWSSVCRGGLGLGGASDMSSSGA